MNKKELEECEKKKQEFFAGWQREKADFINYKKKEGERLTEITEAMRENLLLRILPVLDSFSLAEKTIPEKEKEGKNVKGLLLIKKQLKEFLKSEGIEEIPCGKEFNPCLHEAVGEVVGGGEEGTIAEEVEKGYQFKETVIRPAKVKINKSKS
ncbi:MAG: nucleotide exchange factor GrpE [Candidatus Paceibacterota bacterium]|jgi:molecular chaperone GrpE|nr:nucleotide exchange factor GrpE [Candidatus Paceibacterota bacterium]MDD5555302.1 nucleotide exchange factor GrpE [Candidatus Paceibacterota bacterium]